MTKPINFSKLGDRAFQPNSHSGFWHARRLFKKRIFGAFEEYTNRVSKNRKKDIDRLFGKWYIESHTKGKNKIRIRRGGNWLVADVESLSGGFDIDFYPNIGTTIRPEHCGDVQPDFVVYTGKRLTIEDGSAFWNEDSLQPDSIKNKTYRKFFHSRHYDFNRTDDLKNRNVLFVTTSRGFDASKDSFLKLRKITRKKVSRINFESPAGNNFAVFLTRFADTTVLPRPFPRLTIIGVLAALVILSEDAEILGSLFN